MDIETIWDEDIAKPICIAITSGKKIHFKGIKIKEVEESSILKFLLEKCSGKKIYYVHNLTFEVFVFLSYMVKEKIKFKMISSNRNVYSADIFYKNKKIKLKCSYRLTMLSLKKLSELAEVEEKTPFPYKILNKNMEDITDIKENMFNSKLEYEEFKKNKGSRIETYKILEEYCKNDAKITKESIIKYWKIIEENGLKNNGNILTAAKLSIENYFKNNNVIKKKIPIKIDRILRKGYFGGRTEVFGNPKENEIVLHFDWSGMYAQCMQERVLGGEVFQSNIIKHIKEPGFYWIKFKQSLEIPILPIKTNKLMFVNGVLEGWYWFEEIMLALEYGVRIISIEKVISCQYFDFFIKDFVEINNKIREISPLHKQIGKNNNNTFYGRLGMNPERLEEEIINKIDDKYEKVIKYGNIFLGYKKKEKSISNVIISASITSKARIKLYKGMIEVIKKGGRILYTDTDSILAAFKKNIYLEILDNNIGEVKFDSKKEDTIIEDAVFAMPKTYGLKYLNKKEIVKIKGFNKNPSFDEFKKTFYEKREIETENIEWSKKDFNVKYTNKMKKTNLNGLDKRIWEENLKNTKPITLNVPY